jgi:NADH-quinone oxidoreductase subunit C
MPDAPGLELIRQEINDEHPDAVLDTSFDHGQAALIADPRQVLEVLRWLRDSPGQQYSFLSSLHAADYLPAEPRGDSLPEIDSCVTLYPTAEFHEREVYDFFGIVFRGHPDLRRILLPEDYVGWPLRRDYPVGGEPVLFTKDEPGSPGWYE